MRCRIEYPNRHVYVGGKQVKTYVHRKMFEDEAFYNGMDPGYYVRTHRPVEPQDQVETRRPDSD